MYSFRLISELSYVSYVASAQIARDCNGLKVGTCSNEIQVSLLPCLIWHCRPPNKEIVVCIL